MRLVFDVQTFGPGVRRAMDQYSGAVFPGGNFQVAADLDNWVLLAPDVTTPYHLDCLSDCCQVARNREQHRERLHKRMSKEQYIQ